VGGRGKYTTPGEASLSKHKTAFALFLLEYNLIIGNSNKPFSVIDWKGLHSAIVDLEAGCFIIIESAGFPGGSHFIQVLREDEERYQCEYRAGSVLFGTEPKYAGLELVTACLTFYFSTGPSSDEFQTVFKWVPIGFTGPDSTNQQGCKKGSKNPIGEDRLWRKATEIARQRIRQRANEEDLYSGERNSTMTGIDFERNIAQFLQEDGWLTRLTRRTGDQGLDLMAYSDEFIVAMQIKCYSSPVSNSAIQEVHAAADMIGATHAVVVAKSGFTRSAMSLAITLGIVLLAPKQLVDLRSHLTYVKPRQKRRLGPKLFPDT